MPHAADLVLANGYGDCKDQVMLMMALLHAKGIAADPVLINAGASYTLPGPPVVNAFTHCITYLPEWDTYADTTAGGAPFGTLPFTDYGKAIVRGIASGPVLGHTPVVPEGIATASLRTTARIGATGEISGESVTTATGPFATVLRIDARRAQSTGSQRWAANLLRQRREPGTGDVSIAPLDPVGENYRISGVFTLEPKPGWMEGDSFAIPTGLRMLDRPGETLAGPLRMDNLPATEPTPCYAGREDEELVLTLPDGRSPERLPLDRDIAGDGFHYTSHYAFADSAITVHRSFETHFHEALCAGPQRAALAKAFAIIRRDLNAQVALK